MGWWVTYYTAKLAKQPGQVAVSCSGMEWGGGEEGGGVGEREG